MVFSVQDETQWQHATNSVCESLILKMIDFSRVLPSFVFILVPFGSLFDHRLWDTLCDEVL